jgi:hypothetical protein
LRNCACVIKMYFTDFKLEKLLTVSLDEEMVGGKEFLVWIGGLNKNEL